MKKRILSAVLISTLILIVTAYSNSKDSSKADYIVASNENDQVSTELISSESSEIKTSDEKNNILPWISEYLEEYMMIEEDLIKEITFAITSNRTIPDVFILLKDEKNTSRESIYSFTDENSNTDSCFLEYPFHENTENYITTTIIRNGKMGIKINENLSYSGVYKSEIGMMSLDEFAPNLAGSQIIDSDENSFGIFETTRFINLYPQILKHYGKMGIGKFSSNSQEYFFGKTNFLDERMVELKDNPNILIDYIKSNYYNPITQQYEMYFGEEGIVDYLRYGKEYEYPGGENLRNVVLSKEEYESLYPQLMELFTETRFSWVYKSGTLPDNYTKEDILQIAKQATKSYLEYLESSDEKSDN